MTSSTGPISSGAPPASETDVLWFLPTHGDGRYLASDIGARHVTHGLSEPGGARRR